MRRRKGRFILLGVIVFLGLAFYICYIDRAHARVEHAGWSLDFSYIRMACRFCLGRVERLTVHGRPLPWPRLSEDSPMLTVIAPVGRFEARRGLDEYRCHDARVQPREAAGEPLSEAERARGYYETTGDASWPPACRPGTPEDWCFASNWYRSYWLDPSKLGELNWTDTSKDAAPHSSKPEMNNE